MASHPTRVRGLKSIIVPLVEDIADVAPYTGAWIEIYDGELDSNTNFVAPYTGAWIEILTSWT